VLAAVGGYLGWRRLVEYSATHVAYVSVQEPNFSLIVDAYENLEGVLLYRRIARSVVRDKSTDLEKITALNMWAHNHVRSIYKRFPEDVIDDNFYNILRRGHGYCDQIAHVFATLGYFAGYKTRLFMLKDPKTNISTHTVAQVRLNGQWRFVEPYLGIVPLTSQHQLPSLDDLKREPGILINYYEQANVPLTLADFPDGTPFYTFPYIGLDGLVKKMFSRRSINQPVASAAQAPEGTASSKGLGKLLDTGMLEKMTVCFDKARRLQLDGAYARARARYTQLLAQDLPDDLREEVLFFHAFSFFEEGNFAEAIESWDRLLIFKSDSPWIPSSHYFTGEAYVKLGDTENALKHFQSANTPTAKLRYASLRQERRARSEERGAKGQP
jgi:hypothetical protein